MWQFHKRTSAGHTRLRVWASVLPISALILFPAPACAAAPAAVLQDSGLKGKYITALAVHKDALWVGTEKEGVHVLADGKWQAVSTESIGDPNCTALAVTPDGSLWVGTGRHGLAVRCKGEWRRLGIIEGLPGMHVYALAADPTRRARVWCSTEGGVCSIQLSGGESQPGFKVAVAHWPLAYPVLEFGALTVHPQSGVLYAGALIGGAASWDGRRWRLFPPGEKDLGDQINAVVCGADKHVWAATKHGPARLDPARGEWSRVPFPKRNKDPFLSSICLDASGRVWAGTRRYGLFLYDPKGKAFRPAGIRLPARSGSKGNDAHVFTLAAAEREGVWVGLYGQGVHRVAASSGGLPSGKWGP